VHTFYQPLFSHTFSFSNFSLAILFRSKSFPHQKAQSKRTKQKPPQNLLKQKISRQKVKSSQPSFSGPFINSGKQGGTEALGEGRDIISGETCVPVSLNASLGEAVVLLFSVS
jgi:hypothetical protein